MKKINLILALSMILSACATTAPGKKTAIGTGVGAAAGAGTGLGVGLGYYLDREATELEKIAETRRTEDGIITTLKNSVLFNSDSATLKKPEAMDAISQISDIIKRYPDDYVFVVGYADDRGSENHNLQLSEQRAKIVRLAMISKGVAPDKVEAMGMGESNPVGDNKTDASRAKNRRVELQITMKPAKPTQ